MPDGEADIEQGFETMWKGIAPKPESFKEDVKGAVKTLVFGELQKLEKRMEAGFEETR